MALRESHCFLIRSAPIKMPLDRTKSLCERVSTLSLVDNRESVIRPGYDGRETPYRYAWPLFLFAGGNTVSVIELVCEGAAFLPSGSFGPGEENVAVLVNGDTRMLSALSLSRSGDGLSHCAAGNAGP